jgi:multiple sugar transport system permease protein
VAPYVLFLFAIFAYPLGFAVYMSFHDYFFAAPGAIVERPFVGLDNFTTALNAAIPFRTFFRAGYFVPYVTASVAVIGVWLWLFNSGGLVNTVLGPLAPDPSWLVNSFWAMPIIALFATWKQLGLYVLLYLAALQNIPEELYEAAEVDGAGPVRRFLAVTVPGVRPTTTLVVIAATITGANFFTEPYLLTGRGGPAGASVSPVLLMYTQGIEQGKAGYAAAIGILLAIGVMVISLVYRFVLERS